jgi:hypothetical protein
MEANTPELQQLWESKLGAPVPEIAQFNRWNCAYGFDNVVYAIERTARKQFVMTKRSTPLSDMQLRSYCGSVARCHTEEQIEAAQAALPDAERLGCPQAWLEQDAVSG